MGKRARPKWDLGRKVSLWLADQKSAGRTPSSRKELADLIGVDWGTVNAWITRGSRPRSDILHRLAQIMGADPAWLADDSRGYPPPDAAQSLSVVLRMITDDEQKTLAEILRDPVERRAWIAAWSSRRGRP